MLAVVGYLFGSLVCLVLICAIMAVAIYAFHGLKNLAKNGPIN